jgi:predicted restriction endonuclease
MDAIHLVPDHLSGTDDPRNGLVLCKLHHKCFDVGLFNIEPDSLKILAKAVGPNLVQMRITRKSIIHLEKKPHIEALNWIWKRASQQ